MKSEAISTYLMSRGFFSIEAPLYGDSAVFIDMKLPLAIGTSVNRVRNLTVPSLVGVRRFEGFQAISDFRVLEYRRFDV